MNQVERSRERKTCGERGVGNTKTTPQARKGALIPLKNVENDVVDLVDENVVLEAKTKPKTTKTKQQSLQLKNWFFTWNNYQERDIIVLENRLKEICISYVFQEETGKDSEVKHLQGCIKLKKAMRWSEFKLPNVIHWEKTRNQGAAEEYCAKDDTRTGKIYRFGVKIPTEIKIITDLYPWQKQMVELFKEVPDDRTIHWIFDPSGNCGKTKFAKYAVIKCNAIIATSGSYRDIACILAMKKKAGIEIGEETPFIFSFARTSGAISYKAIEAIKDGLVTSSKYESDTFVFNCPHVIILSNDPPIVNKLSIDRWKVYSINDKNELVKLTTEEVIKLNKKKVDDEIEFNDVDN